VAQTILNCSQRLAARSSGLTRAAIWRASSSIARGAGLSNCVVQCDVYGSTLDVPGDMGLASMLSRCPKYGRNVERFAAAVARKYANASMIDVGANIGDTALLMRRGATGPILCIEGSPRYAAVCQRNLESVSQITVVNAFVDTGSTIRARMVETNGTGSAVFDESSEIPTVALAEIVQRFGFANAKLLKIDTDGFDGRIIEGALSWLQNAMPIMYWELDLTSDQEHAGPGTKVFESLSKIGYDQVMFYSNTGDYILTTSTRNHDLLEDLSWYTSMREDRLRVPPAYADVCAFPSIDADLAEALQAEERLLRLPAG